MSLNQSRFDKNDSHFRKPGGGRSGSSSGGHSRNFTASRGRGGGGAPTHTPAPPLPSNRSYKKVNNNTQGGQTRGNVGPVNTSDLNTAAGSRSVENGGLSQSVSNAPTPAVIPKPADASSQKTSRPLPKAPSSQSSSMNSDSAQPSTPAKGDGGKGFPLQFGSISPGFMNGMQVPARTSSAPPNLDEQKRDQARREAARAVPPIPLPSAPKQDLPKKDVIEHPVAQESNTNKGKRDVQVASASPPTQAQKPATHSTAGVSMPLPYHQPAMQFGGPNPQIQSQAMPSSSLQMPMQMPLQMGNPSQVPQQVFMPGLQHPLMQSAGIMHHGQNLGFNPQLAPPLSHQHGNVGMNMSTQYNQQQAGKYVNTRKAVKITHPETHEELRLDSRDGGSVASRAHQSGPSQSQPVPTYTATHPMGYYSNSYTAGPPFFPVQGSLPLTTAQLNPSSQGPRFNYSGSQAPPTMPFVNQAASNTYSVSRVGTSVHVAPEPTNSELVRDAKNTASVQSSSVPVTVKASGVAAREVVTNSTAVESPVVDPSSVRKDKEVNTENSSVQPKSTASAASVAAETSSSVASPDMSPSDSSAKLAHPNTVNKESIIKSTCVRDNEKTSNKKGYVESSNQVDGQSYSGVCQDLGDSSEAAVSESAEAKSSHPLSGSKVVEPVVGQESSMIAAPRIIHDVNLGADCPTLSSESHEIHKTGNMEHAKQSDHSLLEKTTKESTDSGENQVEVRSSDTINEIDQDKQSNKVGHVKGAVEASQIEADPADSSVKADNSTSISSSFEHDSSIVSDRGSISDSNTSLGTADGVSCKDNDISKSALSDNEATSASANISDPHLGPEEESMENSRPNSSSGTINSSKTSIEPIKTKHRGKKKWKELLSKADALGTTADLYMAYKGPEEKKETGVVTELSSEDYSKEVAGEIKLEEITGKNKDEQSKAEIDDWEDAAEISTPKLDSSVKRGRGGPIHDEEGVTAKKYSRDFLLTFSAQCTHLPIGFEITSDIAVALISVNMNASLNDREYSNPGRAIDRSVGAARSDRRGSGTMDAERWKQQPGPYPNVRDPSMDLAFGSNTMGFRSGPGPSYGVLRNPRAQGPVPHVGGILSGPMHSMGFQGMPRNNADADRWQRGTNFNKGLMSVPQGPAQIMHKAERKYEIGKISDEEEAKQRRLKGILNKLTPQNFEKLFEQVKEVNIDNSVTLTGVIAQIFDKALTEPTFCEMYANFCFHLASELPELSVDNEKITFRRLLLNKCQEEFERGEREEQEANKADNEGEDENKESEGVREEKRLKARRRMLGNIRLIGELYKKKMLTERIMHECIKKLLGQYQNPDEENIEALCKLMSTIGEMIDHPKAKEHMDAYFDIMSRLSNNMKLSSRVRFMLRDSIDLRKNKWQQRRKIEGPKKIEEVHRDAAQERQGQAGRPRGPNMNPAMRRGPPADFAPRGSMLSSPMGQGGGFRAMPSQVSPQVRGFMGQGQDARIDERNIYENRTLSVPLPQRLSSDESITLGPQGGLARGMAYRGPTMSNSPLLDSSPAYADSRRLVGALNGYSNMPERGVYSTREDHFMRNASDRFGTPVSYDQSSSHELNANRDVRFPDRNVDRTRPITPPVVRAAPAQNISSEKLLSEDLLRDKSIAAIREYYSAKDEKEVSLCIRDLDAPSFYPTVVSIWVTDSFERKDLERDMLSKLLVNLTRPQEGLFSPSQLVEGFQSVLFNLEDTVTDAPKAPEFLGRIFARVVIDDVIPLKDVGQLIHDGGEMPGSLREAGLAGEILGSILEMIKSERGESVLNEFRAGLNLRLEDFRPPDSIRSRKLEMFI